VWGVRGRGLPDGAESEVGAGLPCRTGRVPPPDPGDAQEADGDAAFQGKRNIRHCHRSASGAGRLKFTPMAEPNILGRSG